MSDGLKQVQLCFVGEVGEVEMREGDVRLRLFESGGGMKTRTCTLVDLGARNDEEKCDGVRERPYMKIFA
jgi:hypothetical protein